MSLGHPSARLSSIQRGRGAPQIAPGSSLAKTDDLAWKAISREETDKARPVLAATTLLYLLEVCKTDSPGGQEVPVAIELELLRLAE